MFVGVHDSSGSAAGASSLARAAQGQVITGSAESGAVTVLWGQGVQGRANADGLLWVLDGRLSNDVDIARDLGLRHGATTGELIPAAWKAWGRGLLPKLRGAFAILVWDGQHGILARDQLGSRPMFTHTRSGRLTFSSDVRFIADSLGRAPEPNRDALVRWLANESMPGQATLYTGIERLAPGTEIRLERKRAYPRTYWIPRYREPVHGDADEWAGRLRGDIARATAAQVDDWGSTIVSLSGGLDSGTVAAAASTLARAEGSPAPPGISAVFPGYPDTDESAYVTATAAALEMESIQVSVQGGSPFRAALEYLRDWRVPLFSPNDFFWRPLLRIAVEEGAPTVLDGEGGDELFGFSPFLIADRLRRGRALNAVRLMRAVPGQARPRSRRQQARILMRYGLMGAAPYGLHPLLKKRRPAYGPRWFTDASARRFSEVDDPARWKRLDGPRWWAYLADVLTSRDEVGVSEYIRRRDLTENADSRHPLLQDVDLVELMLRVPPELGFHPDYDRALERRAMRGLVPDLVRLRPDKSFFTSFFDDRMVNVDWAHLQRLLDTDDAEIYAFVQRARVRDDLLAGPPPAGTATRALWGMTIWNLANAECWLRSLGDPGFPQRMLDELALPGPVCSRVGLGPREIRST